MVQTCQIDLANNVQKILDSDKTDVDPEAERAPPTIIHAALTSDLRPQDKTLQPLLDRAFNILGAGAETTSWALSVIIYYLLTQPVTLRRLTAELMTVVRDPNQLPSWTELEKLPYLDAVIQEGLRLSCTWFPVLVWAFPDHMCDAMLIQCCYRWRICSNCPHTYRGGSGL